MTEARTDHHLRDVLVARFVIRSEGALHIGIGCYGHRAVFERKFNDALQRQRFYRMSRKETTENHGAEKQSAAHHLRRRFHFFTVFRVGSTECRVPRNTILP